MSGDSLAASLAAREVECAALEALLDRVQAGRSAALAIRGEAGIGKSALLAHLRTRARGLRIVEVVCVESEAELPFAALDQILRPLAPYLPALVRAQSEALQAALGRGGKAAADRFLVGAATLSLLAAAAEQQPLLCLVDDGQWIDRSSRDALLFAARRLEAESVAVVVAERGDAPGAGNDLPELWLHALRPEQARQLLEARYGSDLAAAVRERLVAAAAGNPLALVEFAAALTETQRLGRERLPEPLALTGGVERVYRDRVRLLDPGTQTLLLLAAADGTGDAAVLLAAARELGIDVAALRPAEQDGLLHVTAERIAFRHPLVRSAVYLGATFADRQRAHSALADVLVRPDDADRRAWHLAAAAVGADEDVADQLERTADRARLRAGYAAAASAMERAAQLTARPDVRVRRLVNAADAAVRAGEGTRALSLLEQAEDDIEPSSLRATAAEVRGVIELRAGTPAAAVPLFLSAAKHASGDDDGVAIRYAMRAAEAAALGGEFGRVAEIQRWVEALPPAGSPEDRVIRGLLEGLVAVYAGEPANGVPPFRRALAAADEVAESDALHWAATAANYLGKEQRSAELYRAAVDRARSTGEVYALPFSLLRLATIEFGGHGRRAAAEADANEALRLARETGQDAVAAHCLALLAQAAAMRGAEDECNTLVDAALAIATPRRLRLASTTAAFALAELDLALGRALRALERFEGLLQGGEGHPLYELFGMPTIVEAAARAGWSDRVRPWFSRYERWAAAADPMHTRPLVERCRALLADDTAREAHFEEALRLHAECPQPYARARTQLAYGEFLRRAKRKADARRQLRPAMETFDAVGATPWAERARNELRATGETARRRADAARGELTPQELQVARLVARGATNREVAAQLFVSPKTVEYHLHKVFAKLGIGSRTELARLEMEPEAILAAPSAGAN